jgi:hypothetical protein
MDREKVESSAIRSVGYEPRRQLLEVEFHSGRVYRYHDVPPATHRRLLAAESKGRFFNFEVKPGYRCERVI